MDRNIGYVPSLHRKRAGVWCGLVHHGGIFSVGAESTIIAKGQDQHWLHQASFYLVFETKFLYVVLAVLELAL